MPEPERKSTNDLLRFTGLGMQLALLGVLFGWGGTKLDEWLDTSPLLLIVGCLLGLALGMYAVIRDVTGSSLERRPPRKKDGGSAPP